MHGLFPDSHLLSHFTNRRTYSVGRIQSLAQVFAQLQASQDRGEILSYSVTQTSLEEVFLQIASHQED